MSGWLMLPDSCRVWGDCDVVLSLVNHDGTTRELSKQHLDPAVPEAPFTLDLPADARATLRLTLGEGRFGPIQDQVILRRVLIAK